MTKNRTANEGEPARGSAEDTYHNPLTGLPEDNGRGGIPPEPVAPEGEGSAVAALFECGENSYMWKWITPAAM